MVQVIGEVGRYLEHRREPAVDAEGVRVVVLPPLGDGGDFLASYGRGLDAMDAAVP